MINLAIKTFADQKFYSAELGRATLQLSNLCHIIGEEGLSQESLEQAKVLYNGISPGGFPSTPDLEVYEFTKLICYNYR